VFISVDPERDTPGRIKSYVKDFHPQMLGLTGDLEDVKKTSKAYRCGISKETKGPLGARISRYTLTGVQVVVLASETVKNRCGSGGTPLL
jgi:cytochrome oxidase Cu insertion factor (SCO1/SenC/PrrC family)